MNKKKTRIIYLSVLCVLIAAIVISICVMKFSGEKSASSSSLEADDALVTNSYQTEITIEEDSTYIVHEKIDCSFLEERHGIYRYIPYMQSVQVRLSDGTYALRPFYADVTMKSHNEQYSKESENGSVCYQFGDEEILITDKVYDFTYSYSPRMDEQITMAAYNIFPTGWRSSIPAGSSFSITFPKAIELSELKFTYGTYGETKDADSIIDFTYDGNTVTGTLQEDLSVFSGLSFYIDLPEGYFTKTEDMSFVNRILSIFAAIFAAVGLISFIASGRRRRIRPVACFAPPKGVDSALAGYLVDGSIEDKDILSLVTYFACEGLLSIKKDEHDKISFIKTGNLPEDAPEYLSTVFHGIFGKFADIGDEVKLEKLKDKFYIKIAEAKQQLAKYAKKEFGGVFKPAPEVLRGINLFLFLMYIIFVVIMAGAYSNFSAMLIIDSILFALVGFSALAMCCNICNIWHLLKKESKRFYLLYHIVFVICTIALYMIPYSIGAANHEYFDFSYGIAASMAALVINGLCTVYMRRRSMRSCEYMNLLLGYRDYIDTSDIEGKQKAFAANPEMFYSVLPYASVFGLTDEWMLHGEKMNLTAPSWYVDEGPAGRRQMGLNCMAFMTVYYAGMSDMKKTMTSVPVSSDSSGSSSFGGGSGFSGGGFGGGGGGSW